MEAGGERNFTDAILDKGLAIRALNENGLIEYIPLEDLRGLHFWQSLSPPNDHEEGEAWIQFVSSLYKGPIYRTDLSISIHSRQPGFLNLLKKRTSYITGLWPMN